MITNADITIYHETYNKETRLKEWTSSSILALTGTESRPFL